jgi:hypothetical protein
MTRGNRAGHPRKSTSDDGANTKSTSDFGEREKVRYVVAVLRRLHTPWRPQTLGRGFLFWRNDLPRGFFEPQIDHFVMAITSAEARVWHIAARSD